MFNIASTHTLQNIERLHLQGPSGDQVQTPAPLKAYKASYTDIYFGSGSQLCLTSVTMT